MAAPKNKSERKQSLPLSEAAGKLLDECRMVLPGIQALFGFQLIAVFNSNFAEKLSATLQQLHLLSMILVIVAAALVMTPAAYHRQTNPCLVSEHFIRLSSRLLLLAMCSLASGLSLEVYLISSIIVSELFARTLAIGILLLLVFLWFTFKHVVSNERE